MTLVDDGVEGRRYRCSQCGLVGHNKRSCGQTIPRPVPAPSRRADPLPEPPSLPGEELPAPVPSERPGRPSRSEHVFRGLKALGATSQDPHPLLVAIVEHGQSLPRCEDEDETGRRCTRMATHGFGGWVHCEEHSEPEDELLPWVRSLRTMLRLAAQLSPGNRRGSEADAEQEHHQQHHEDDARG